MLKGWRCMRCPMDVLALDTDSPFPTNWIQSARWKVQPLLSPQL